MMELYFIFILRLRDDGTLFFLHIASQRRWNLIFFHIASQRRWSFFFFILRLKNAVISVIGHAFAALLLGVTFLLSWMAAAGIH